jgi:hypothetical protein
LEVETFQGDRLQINEMNAAKHNAKTIDHQGYLYLYIAPRKGIAIPDTDKTARQRQMAIAIS